MASWRPSTWMPASNMLSQSQSRGLCEIIAVLWCDEPGEYDGWKILTVAAVELWVMTQQLCSDISFLSTIYKCSYCLTRAICYAGHVIVCDAPTVTSTCCHLTTYNGPQTPTISSYVITCPTISDLSPSWKQRKVHLLFDWWLFHCKFYSN